MSLEIRETLVYISYCEYREISEIKTLNNEQNFTNMTKELNVVRMHNPRFALQDRAICPFNSSREHP